MSDWHNCWVGFLETPIRARTVFRREGIYSIGQIDAMTFAELKDLPGIGPKTAGEVFGAVDRFRKEFRLGRAEVKTQEEFERAQRDRYPGMLKDRQP